MIPTGRHSDTWYQREPLPIVCLAPGVLSASVRPWTPCPALRREDVTLGLDRAMRLVAATWPGTQVELEGRWVGIRIGNVSPDTSTERR